MADYYRLISRAVSELDSDQDAERRALYERARAMLVSRLQKLDPPLDEIRRTNERLALEEAFRRVEAGIEAAAECGLPYAEYESHAAIVAALGSIAQAVHQQSHGARIELTGGGALRFALAASDGDRSIAASRLIELNRADLQARCATLEDRVRRMPWQPRWVGLTRAVDILGGLLEQPVPLTVDRIGVVWSLIVALRAYMEQNEDGRRDSFLPDDTLDGDLVHTVTDFVLAAGPWVRRFPSGRSLDDDIATWVDADGDLEQAAALLQRVERLALFGGEDAVILAIALDAGRGDSVPAIRARSWANATIRNIGIVLVQTLVAVAKAKTGSGGAASARSPEVAQAIEIIVIDGRDELANLLSPLAKGLDADTVLAGFEKLAPMPG
jgi:hypothetical protein